LIEQITHQVTNNELGYDPQVTQLEQFGELRIPGKIREVVFGLFIYQIPLYPY